MNNAGARAAFAVAHGQSQALEKAGFAPEAVSRVQSQKLDLLWARAADIPYYQALPGFHDRDLSRLPVTGKEVLKARPHEFVRPSLPDVLKYYESSGSSGVPTPTPRLAEDTIANVISVSALWRRALGDRPCRVAALLPSDVVPVGDFVASACEYLGHTLLRCYPFSLGICDWDRLEGLFANYRPDRVFAAPGVLTQWTRILKARGRLTEVRASVRTILLLGEVSLPAQRRKLAQDWRADVLDASYGSTETGTIAATCAQGSLHLLLPGHLVELRDGDTIGVAAPGAAGELVTTTLNNYARPLLRFGTGDRVDVLADPCPCGVALPTVVIHGRGADQISLRGVALTEHLVGSLVYEDPRLTGYLIQLDADGSGRLVLEKDVDVADPDEQLAMEATKRCVEAGLAWDDVVVVSQLPATSKSGSSQKNWKRTNVATLR